MITQDEHTARHSPAGACVFPAGSDGVGGLSFACGSAHGAGTVRRPGACGIHSIAVGI